ncbi:MOSC N-terminal beta barrel domain-containing protein [Candidatus Methylomirabilis sp.]|uniref:MOSC domain-containing protein n=1 Tax=Candidatus Methylomirabilis sp. TaxID=2032687 RepID=UPI002A5F8801|nr:MOSC N-terminal beta barrel domain-containing protein [Candidatus Methylomirabilis sp.]
MSKEVSIGIGRVREIWRYPVKSMIGERLDRGHVGTQGLWGDRGWAIRDEATGEIHNAKRHPILMQCSAMYRAEPRADHIPHVDITLPDGVTVSSDSPAASQRLSELIGRSVTLRPVQPAAETAYYRRREPGAALLGRLWAYRPARRLLQRLILRGPVAKELRTALGREPEEPLPDLSGVPPVAWEYYTPPGTYFDLFPIQVLTTSTLQLMSQLNPAANWDVRRFRPNVLVDTESAIGAVENDWVGRAIRIGNLVVKGELPTIRCAMPMHAQADLPRDPSVLRTIVREANQCLGVYASVIEAGSIGTGDPVELAPHSVT